MEYKIVKRTRTSFIDETGVSVDGYRVHYVMPDGTSDYVEIAKTQFSPDVVKAAIEEAITVHEDLMS